MFTEPLDVEDLLRAAPGPEPPRHADPGLTLGHVHLHVGDVPEARALLPRRDRLRADGRAARRRVRVGGRLPPPPRPQQLARRRACRRRRADAVGLRFWTLLLDGQDELARGARAHRGGRRRRRGARRRACSCATPPGTAVVLTPPLAPRATASGRRPKPCGGSPGGGPKPRARPRAPPRRGGRSAREALEDLVGLAAGQVPVPSRPRRAASRAPSWRRPCTSSSDLPCALATCCERLAVAQLREELRPRRCRAHRPRRRARRRARRSRGRAAGRGSRCRSKPGPPRAARARRAPGRSAWRCFLISSACSWVRSPSFTAWSSWASSALRQRVLQLVRVSRRGAWRRR